MRAITLALPLLPTALWADAPRVATDIAPVHSIVASVMQGVGTPDLIVRPGASPHGYSMRPSEAQALNDADLVVWVGPSLTPWMDGPVDALAGEASVLTLMDVPGITTLPFREGATFADGHDHGDDDHGHDDHAGHDHDDHGHEEQAAAKDADHDHDHGHDDHAGHDHDDHGHDHAGGIDPHSWLDPQNASLWAQSIALQLSVLDPENAGTYVTNAAAFADEMTALSAELEQTLAPVQGKPFVVFHDAYHYFEDRFGLEAAGAISASDAAAASAARVAEARERVEELGAVCALTEPQFNPGIVNAIGAATLGEIDPLGVALEPGADLYAGLLRNMAASLVDCLN